MFSGLVTKTVSVFALNVHCALFICTEMINDQFGLEFNRVVLFDSSFGAFIRFYWNWFYWEHLHIVQLSLLFYHPALIRRQHHCTFHSVYNCWGSNWSWYSDMVIDVWFLTNIASSRTITTDSAQSEQRHLSDRSRLEKHDQRFTKMVHLHYYELGKVRRSVWPPQWRKSCLLVKITNR